MKPDAKHAGKLEGKIDETAAPAKEVASDGGLDARSVFRAKHRANDHFA